MYVCAFVIARRDHTTCRTLETVLVTFDSRYTTLRIHEAITRTVVKCCVS